MRISLFCRNGVEEISFALWEGEKLVDLIVYQKHPFDSKEESFKRELLVDHLEMMVDRDKEVTRQEIEDLIAKIKAIKVHFI